MTTEGFPGREVNFIATHRTVTVSMALMAVTTEDCGLEASAVWTSVAVAFPDVRPGGPDYWQESGPLSPTPIGAMRAMLSMENGEVSQWTATGTRADCAGVE